MGYLQSFIDDLKETTEAALPLLHSFFWSRDDERNIEWKAGYALYTDCYMIAEKQLSTLRIASQLASEDNYREALILCRSCYEYYCYFRLMCEADRFTLLFTPDDGETLPDFTARIEADLEKRRAAGETYLLHTSQQSRLKGRHLGVVLESSVRATHHYWSVFKVFDSAECFLDLEKYANYYEHSDDDDIRQQIRERDQQSKKDQSIRYKAWLTQEATQEHLLENGLITRDQHQLAKAHYAYLSSFTHPSADGLDKLNQKNRDVRELLIQNYCAFMAAGFAHSMLRLIERDREYVISFTDPGIRNLYNSLHKKHDYFWFITSEPCAYDYFDNWGKIARPTENPLDIPRDKVKPVPDPFLRLSEVFQGVRTARIKDGKRVGQIFYYPPQSPGVSGKIRLSHSRKT